MVEDQDTQKLDYFYVQTQLYPNRLGILGIQTLEEM